MVEAVVVTPTAIEIRGSRTALESAVLDDSTGTGQVPSFDPVWCPKHDKKGHSNHWKIFIPTVANS